MWWKLRDLEPPALYVRLGELRLWLQAEPGELVLHQRRDPELDEEVELGVEAPPEDADQSRFVLASTPRQVLLTPRLVERSVVARPRVPVFLPPKEKVAIFVTSPLRVSVQHEEVELVELPIGMPAETWFGPSPVRGELCYASRTRGTRTIEELEAPPTRVVTKVLLENQGKTTLEAKSIRLPMPKLSLAWHGEHEELATETVRLIRDDADQAELKIEELPRGVTLLAPPRDPSRAVWKQALTALWS